MWDRLEDKKLCSDEENVNFAACMKDKLKDLLLDVALGAAFLFVASIAAPVAICNWLKGLFEKPKEKELELKRENDGRFFCMSCGTDFEPEQFIENKDGQTAGSCCRKCPKCGEESVIPKFLLSIICGPAWMPHIEE